MRYVAVLLALIFLVSGCSSPEAGVASEATVSEDFSGWREVEFTDSLTGASFKVSGFEGENVLIESFAVWCSTCLKQQKEMQDYDVEGVVHVSLNTDPNEDMGKVRTHVERYGFDWRFAVASAEVTRDLIDEFGISVVNAPQAPVILVCPDQSARLLPRGVKSPEDLAGEVAKGC